MELIVPVLIGVTLIWLVGRGAPLNVKLVTAAIALALVILIVSLERGGWWPAALTR